jgi:hypothetical protein
MFNAVSWQLFGAGSGQNKVALEAGVDDLNDDVLVGKADDKAVFWGVTRQVRCQMQTVVRVTSRPTTCSSPVSQVVYEHSLEWT